MYVYIIGYMFAAIRRNKRYTRYA